MLKKIGKFLLVLVVLGISMGLILYPFVSNYLFENRADGIIDTVEKTADDADEEKYKEEIEAAQKYNAELATGHVVLKDPFVEEKLDEDAKEYNSLLNMADGGVMGFIKIPCIDVSLPIYHGTSAEILELGAGHLQGTSLPIGGESTHSVITGHTGLSSAKLFTDLTELEEGDMFFLHVMGEKLAYKVDQISVILPEEMDKLTIENGKDYCTLVTCTPYGVNTHRLLVRGERIEYTEDKEEEAGTEVKKTQSKWMEEYTKSIIISSSVLAVMLIVLLIWRHFAGRRRRKRRKKKQTRNNQKRRKKKSSANTNGKRESPDRQKSEARAGKKKRKPREEPD